MQAIVSIFADEGDKIRCVEVGDSKITFLLKSPLYLVVSSSWGEPESVLRTHLDYLYLQVLSVVTLTQLQSIFSRRSNFDLRRMMEGTEPFFHSLVNSLQTSTPILTSSMEVYRLDPNVRSEIAKALDPGREVTKQLDLLYVLLLARGRLVTLLRPKKHSIHPTDLHLLLSTIYSSSPRSKSTASTSVKEPGSEAQTSGEGDEWRNSPLTEPGLESWLPICLPRFNPKGFLHAYVSFLNLPNSTTPASPSNPTASGGGGGGIGLVLLSSDRDGFIAVKEAAEGIKDRLLSSHGRDFTVSAGSNGRSKNRKGGKAGGGLIHEIEKARILQEYSLVELAIPGLRHFVYKSRSLVQSTRPAWEGDYLALSDRYKLITLYQHLADSLHPRPAQTGTPAKRPAQVQYLRTEQEAVLGWSTPQFELYVATSPLLPHSAVVSAAKRISKWVEKEEQKLFLTSSPSF
ncbi:guanine nucleotide exchange factor MON1 [Sporobolomyces salmoneus]|uniref:guanine nucleotide exchange factor MON1 n=1 Tax=Sporobolomyces salmoneus TaxID=183962 RepID=UPI0031722064